MKLLELTGTMDESMMRLGRIFVHMLADGYPDTRGPSQFFSDNKGKHVKLTIEALE